MELELIGVMLTLLFITVLIQALLLMVLLKPEINLLTKGISLHYFYRSHIFIELFHRKMIKDNLVHAGNLKSMEIELLC
jgi:hypothetical protein